ncbi:MAG: hypothetical protein NZ518_01335 [Dehalococcoidia bacterium]|nr:hypothetical protein [Dehalococcoidia bacterium]
MAMAETRGARGPIKFALRALLIFMALFFVVEALWLSVVWINTMKMYINWGTIVIVSGIVGTPPLIGVAVAAYLLRDYWQ